MKDFGHSLLSPNEENGSGAFLLKEGLLNFNHGSFGTVPKSVMDEHIRFLYEQEACPEVWFREKYFQYVNQSRESIASLIHARSEDVVMVENASTAVNAILRSFPFEKGDIILVFSSAYKMITETLRFQEFHQGIVTIEIPIAYPVANEEELIESFKEVIAKHAPRVKLCVFSHISSMPTMIEPIRELSAIAKSHGSRVLLDGAHAPGVIEIFVEEIGCDYYTGNCHKWLFASKGCAFLWVKKDIYTENGKGREENFHPQPVVISSTGKHDYLGRFEYTGTRDYVAFCVLPSALQFINERLGGLIEMRCYCNHLLQEGCHYLVQEWHTSYLVPIQMNGFMANVILPTTNESLLLDMQKRLLNDYSITMVFGQVTARESYHQPYHSFPYKNKEILFPPENDQKIFFIRISTQVYIEKDDFVKLSQAMKAILQWE